MIERYTIDTSVFVASFIEKEPFHSKAQTIINEIFMNDSYVIIPFTDMIELTSAIKRRTGSSNLALRVMDLMKSNKKIKFISLDEVRIDKILKLSIELGLRGMDTIIVQISQEFNTKLITFDSEIIKKLALN